MLKRINPTKTKAWQLLEQHFSEVKEVQMKDLFAQDVYRFDQFSTTFEDLLVDYSKNRITDKTLDLLLQLAEEVALKHAIEQMFSGRKINETENRAVLHTALRNKTGAPVSVSYTHLTLPTIYAV